MRVLVPVKRVVDYAQKVRVLANKKGIDFKNVKMSMNPFCEIATEAAVQLKEQKVATEIIGVSIGPKGCVDTLRSGLALGIDKAVHVTTEEDLQPLTVAKILAAVTAKYEPDLILTGKQSIDGDNNMTPQMLASIMDWSIATNASDIQVNDDKTLSVTREVDGGMQVLKTPLPAVISADLRLNTPRYATLPNIMKARKKPLETLTLEDLGVEANHNLIIEEVNEPATREAGEMVKDVAELVDKLKNEAKVI